MYIRFKKNPSVCAPLPLHWLCSDNWLQAPAARTLACILLQLMLLKKGEMQRALLDTCCVLWALLSLLISQHPDTVFASCVQFQTYSRVALSALVVWIMNIYHESSVRWQQKYGLMVFSLGFPFDLVWVYLDVNLIFYAKQYCLSLLTTHSFSCGWNIKHVTWRDGNVIQL